MAKTDDKGVEKKKTRPVAKRTPKFRRRSEARPDEVLDAALELFMEKGFSATRVEDIARRAGLSKGAVYLYFSSKEALLEGLVRRAIVPVAENALESMGQVTGNPRDMLPVVMQALAARLSDPKFFAIPKIIMREALVAPQIAAIYRAAVLDRVVPMLTGLVAKGIADGYFRPVNPEMAVRSIVGPILAHVLLSEVFGVKPSEGVCIDTLVDTHITILFDGLSMPEGAS